MINKKEYSLLFDEKNCFICCTVCVSYRSMSCTLDLVFVLLCACRWYMRVYLYILMCTYRYNRVVLLFGMLFAFCLLFSIVFIVYCLPVFVHTSLKSDVAHD